MNPLADAIEKRSESGSFMMMLEKLIDERIRKILEEKDNEKSPIVRLESSPVPGP